MNYCRHCGARLDPETGACSRCGGGTRASTDVGSAQTAVAEPAPSEQSGEDRELELALAAANLLRIRRRFREASSRAMETLRCHPANPDTHALLGDIHADTGELGEAQYWYREAIGLDPDNTSYQQRLSRVLARRDRGEEIPADHVGEPAVRETESTESAPPSRLLPLGLTAVAGLALIVGTYVLGQMTRQPHSANTRAQTVERVDSRGAVPPRASTANTPAEAGRDAQWTQTESDLLANLRLELAAREEHGFAVYGVTFDPAAGALIITFQSPTAERDGEARAQVLARARMVARLASSELPRAEFVTVRAAVPEEGRLRLVFVGVATRSSLAARNKGAVFVPEWWE
jgi:hypothetical protein